MRLIWQNNLALIKAAGRIPQLPVSRKAAQLPDDLVGLVDDVRVGVPVGWDLSSHLRRVIQVGSMSAMR